MRKQKSMKSLNLRSIVSLTFFGLVLFFSTPQKAYCQKEALGFVNFTAPKGFTRTVKENVVAFSSYDQTAGKFCIITLYGATPGTGKPESDFKREWANLVLKNMKADASPKTETET